MARSSNGISDAGGYTEAIEIAMEGRGLEDTIPPCLDATNAGGAEYLGTRVIGSFGRAGVYAPPTTTAYVRHAYIFHMRRFGCM